MSLKTCKPVMSPKTVLPSELLLKSQQNVSDKIKNGKANYSVVYPSIILANGETVKDVDLLRKLGVTHILNAAEQHVSVSSAQLAMNKIQYRSFHVDDLPTEDISKYFESSARYINDVIVQGKVILVNCYMGLSRSASCVLAYLIAYQHMTLDYALALVRRSRPINPNEGFIAQLRDFQSKHEKLKAISKPTRKAPSSRSLF